MILQFHFVDFMSLSGTKIPSQSSTAEFKRNTGYSRTKHCADINKYPGVCDVTVDSRQKFSLCEV